jgi:hypothetical protein
VGTSFATSWCQQAWRWNLDYVVDTHGNATTYYYQPEANFYALNESTTAGTKYTRGGYTQRIEYGFNTHVANVYSHAPGQVLFDTAERCFPSGVIACDPGQLTKDTATSWPDVPADRICAENVKCLNASPTFFTRKRYTKISSQVTDGGTGWNAHSAARSAENAAQFARVGIENNAAGNAFLQRHLEEAARADNNILRTFDNDFGTHQARDSLITGPWGFIHLESTWGLSGGIMRLETGWCTDHMTPPSFPRGGGG